MRNLEAPGEIFHGAGEVFRSGMICALIQLAGLLRAYYKSGIGRLGQLVERASPSRASFVALVESRGNCLIVR